MMRAGRVGRWERVARAMCLAALLALMVAALPLGLRYYTHRRYAARVYAPDQAPQRPVAIVFGAAVWSGGRLSPILADRVDTAVGLYHAGIVEKLLMTGDNRVADYNEPLHMAEHAIARGVPPEDVVLDHAGSRTYDSIYRARDIFQVQSAILVTQAYHLDRALFIADHLGLDAVGVAADRHTYRYLARYRWREVLATALAWWEVRVARPEPELGEPLPILAE